MTRSLFLFLAIGFFALVGWSYYQPYRTFDNLGMSFERSRYDEVARDIDFEQFRPSYKSWLTINRLKKQARDSGIEQAYDSMSNDREDKLIDAAMTADRFPDTMETLMKARKASQDSVPQEFRGVSHSRPKHPGRFGVDGLQFDERYLDVNTFEVALFDSTDPRSRAKRPMVLYMCRSGVVTWKLCRLVKLET